MTNEQKYTVPPSPTECQYALKVPPVLIWLAALIVIGLLSLLPCDIMPNLDNCGWLLVVFAAILGFSGINEFRKAQTTVDPLNPAEAEVLVTKGVYSFSRNPMYLGLLLLLIAASLFGQTLMGLVVSAAFVIAMNGLQIKPEEHRLNARFGDKYRKYRLEVGRWI